MFLIILSLFFSVPVAETSSHRIHVMPVSEHTEMDTLEEKLNNAVDAFYRTEWQKAEVLLGELMVDFPNDPRPYFFSSMMPFWEYFFIEQTEEKAALFLEISEKSVELSQKRLNSSPDDTTMVLMLSGLHGYRSLVAAGESNYRVAIQSGLTGFSFTRKLLSLGSERPDARIGRGMFFYMVGSIPREMRWATNMVGIRADTEQGFDELKKAAESDSYVSVDAKMMLMYLYNKDGRYEESLQFAEILTREYPENVIFMFKKAEIHENAGNIETAASFYEKVVEMDNPDFTRLSELSSEKLNELKKLSLKH